MNPKEYPTNKQIFFTALNQRSHQDNDLFSSATKTPYWSLSDLSRLYPNFFDVKSPISIRVTRNFQNDVLTHVPEFSDLTQQPVHILSAHDTYNISVNGKIKTIKDGPDQHLSRVACEYIFRQLNDTAFEQAYFLSPNKKFADVLALSEEIHFENARAKVAASSNVLSAIVNRANDATKTSFGDVWSVMWRVLYNVESFEDLRGLYNVKTTPLDYMSAQTLIFMNKKIHEIISKFCNRNSFTIDEIKDSVFTAATLARKCFKDRNSTPEAQLLPKNTYRRIEKIRELRTKFWKEYYPMSL